MHKSGFLLKVEDKVLQSLSLLELDSVLVDSSEITSENISKIRNLLDDTEIYASLTVFAGEDLLTKFPDAVAVDSAGRDTTKNPLIGVCPTHQGVRAERLARVKEILAEDVDGIWLNHMRYPTQWESPQPEVLDVCYCDRCLKLFEEYIGEPIAGVGGEGSDLENTALHIDGSYYHEWLEFKASHITSFVAEVRALIDSTGKNVKLGVFVVSWKDKEHGAGIQRVVAQDFVKLIPLVDVFSPGLFHKMLGKDVSWVKEMVEYYWQLGHAFLPLVQTEEISDEEFKEALDYAATKPSMGVCIYNLNDLVSQDRLFKVAYETYIR